MKKRKWWLIILIIVIFIFAVRLITQEDDWICVDGDWIRHGIPNSEKPAGYCVDGKVDNFKECVGAGNSVVGSYPRTCTHKNQTFIELIENFCTTENTTDVCTTLYEPVCGYPAEKTFTNSCFACQDSEIIYWIEGACP